jgi:hypothetical protein
MTGIDLHDYITTLRTMIPYVHQAAGATSLWAIAAGLK